MAIDESVDEDLCSWSRASRPTAVDVLPGANLGRIFFAWSKFPFSSIRMTLLFVFMGFFGGEHIHLFVLARIAGEARLSM